MKKILTLKRYLNLEQKLEQSGFRSSTVHHRSHRTVAVEVESGRLEDLSRTIFDSIKNEYEKRHIGKYIKRQAHGLLDLNKISGKVREYISNEKKIGAEFTVENQAVKMLLDYIDRNVFIDLDGFIKFRLKFYKEAITDYTEISIYDLQLEQDYRELISEFGQLIGKQKTKQKTVSVVLGESGYVIMDKDRNRISESEVKKLAREMGGNELSEEELVIGTLINAAPENIHIYRERASNEDLAFEIEEVFKGRVKHVFKDNMQKNKTM